MPFPKKIHFIFVGNLLPKKYAEYIAQWAKHNPDVEINVWVHKESLTENAKSTLSNEPLPDYTHRIIAESSEQELNHIRIRDVKEIHYNPIYHYQEHLQEAYDLYLKEVGLESRHPFDMGVPNYGAASDLLRGVILWQEGGLYSDTDNTCEASIDFNDFDDDPYFYYHVSKGEIPSNGWMACIPSHPYMSTVIKTMNKGLNEVFTDPKLLCPYLGDSSGKESARAEITIARTGPGVLSGLVLTAKTLPKLKTNFLEGKITVNFDNSWLNKVNKSCHNFLKSKTISALESVYRLYEGSPIDKKELTQQAKAIQRKHTDTLKLTNQIESKEAKIYLAQSLRKYGYGGFIAQEMQIDNQLIEKSVISLEELKEEAEILNQIEQGLTQILEIEKKLFETCKELDLLPKEPEFVDDDSWGFSEDEIEKDVSNPLLAQLGVNEQDLDLFFEEDEKQKEVSSSEDLHAQRVNRYLSYNQNNSPSLNSSNPSPLTETVIKDSDKEHDESLDNNPYKPQ